MVILRTGAAAVRQTYFPNALIVSRIRASRSKTFQSIQRQHIRPVAFRNGRFGCVSIKRPSTPAATDARAMVSIISGCPPVTPLVWLGAAAADG